MNEHYHSQDTILNTPWACSLLQSSSAKWDQAVWLRIPEKKKKKKFPKWWKVWQSFQNLPKWCFSRDERSYQGKRLSWPENTSPKMYRKKTLWRERLPKTSSIPDSPPMSVCSMKSYSNVLTVGDIILHVYIILHRPLRGLHNGNSCVLKIPAQGGEGFQTLQAWVLLLHKLLFLALGNNLLLSHCLCCFLKWCCHETSRYYFIAPDIFGALQSLPDLNRVFF